MVWRVTVETVRNQSTFLLAGQSVVTLVYKKYIRQDVQTSGLRLAIVDHPMHDWQTE